MPVEQRPTLETGMPGSGEGIVPESLTLVLEAKLTKPLPCIAEVQGKEYLGPEDVAVLLGVSLHTVRAWRKRDYLPRAFKFRKVIRWKREVIESWIRTHLEGASQPGLRYNGRT